MESDKIMKRVKSAIEKAGVNVDVLETFSNKTKIKNKKFKILLLALIIIFLVSKMKF
jgi:hypothetical protein